MLMQQIKQLAIYFMNHDHFSKNFIFLLCRNWLISTSLGFFKASLFMLCLTSFLSYLILSSLILYSFYFSFNMSIFFPSSSFFCSNQRSMALIFSCHSFSLSLLYCSNVQISSYRLRIIYGVIVGKGFLDLSLSFPAASFCSRSLSFYCLAMYCQWFFLSILSASVILSLMLLPSSLALASSFLRSQILSWYCSSLLSVLRCLVCSFFIFSKLSLSSSSCFSSCLSERSRSSLVIKFLLLYIFYSCLFTLQILLFISVISSCCLRSSPFFSLRVLSSSLGLIPPYFLFLALSFSKIYSSCWESSNICSLSLMFCSIIFYFQEVSSGSDSSCSFSSKDSMCRLGCCDLAFLYLLQFYASPSSRVVVYFSFYCWFLIRQYYKHFVRKCQRHSLNVPQQTKQRLECNVV